MYLYFCTRILPLTIMSVLLTLLLLLCQGWGCLPGGNLPDASLFEPASLVVVLGDAASTACLPLASSAVVLTDAVSAV